MPLLFECNITTFYSQNNVYCIKNTPFYAVYSNYCTKQRSYFLSCLTKEKGGYQPNKLLNLSSFDKQKEYDLSLSKTAYPKEDGYKETHNICK